MPALRCSTRNMYHMVSHSSAIIYLQSRINAEESRLSLQSRVCSWQSNFVSRQTALTFKQLVAPTALALAAVAVLPVAGETNAERYSRLEATRAALLSQEREITKSYDDVTRQIDELRRRQAVLDSYRRQTRDAIRDIERALGNAQ